MKRWTKYLLTICALCVALCMGSSVYGADTRATATAVSSNKVEVRWQETAETSAYKIYRSTTKEGGYKLLDTVRKTVYRDRNIRAGVNYYYRISPISSENNKEIKSLRMTVKVRTPQQIEISRLTVKSSDKIKLYWKLSNGANGYQVYRSAGLKGDYTMIAELKGKSSVVYTDETLIPGKTYYYKIRPTVSNNGQQGYGSFSSPIKGKTVPKAEITSVKSVNSNTLKITWDKIKNASTYQIYRSEKKAGGYEKIAELNNSAVKYSDKNIKSGKKYFYKIVVTGVLNGKEINSGYSKAVSNRTLKQVKISSIKATITDGLKLKWGKITDASSYRIFRSTSKNGNYKRIATVAAKDASAQYYTDHKVKEGKTYYYKVQAYSSENGVIAAGSGSQSTVKKGSTSYAIMGKSTVTAEQMMKLFNASGRTYPSAVYKDKGAKNLKKFCQIVLEECEKEGVKAEVIFAQICLETGYLSFGGQVKPEQCNFAGLGATDDGAAGATFNSVRIGIRAQVQHLKGYASKDSLNLDCVDPRFKYLAYRRGTTPYVQNLGNGNWATDPNYASKLMGLIKMMKSY